MKFVVHESNSTITIGAKNSVGFFGGFYLKATKTSGKFQKAWKATK